MGQAKSEMKKADWRVAETTAYCDRVQDYVTLMVHGDWTAKCVWYSKYKNEAKKRYAGEIKRKIGGCEGPECHAVSEFRDELYAEESCKASKP